MKFFTALVLTLLLSFIGGLWFPWWIIAPIAFAVAILVPQKAWKAGLSGFLGAFLLWALLSAWINAANDYQLAPKISQMLGIGTGSFLLVLVTGFIAGLVAGFAALTGSFIRVRKRP